MWLRGWTELFNFPAGRFPESIHYHRYHHPLLLLDGSSKIIILFFSVWWGQQKAQLWHLHSSCLSLRYQYWLRKFCAWLFYSFPSTDLSPVTVDYPSCLDYRQKTHTITNNKYLSVTLYGPVPTLLFYNFTFKIWQNSQLRICYYAPLQVDHIPAIFIIPNIQ